VIEKYKDSKTKKSPILEWHSFSPRKFEKKWNSFIKCKENTQNTILRQKITGNKLVFNQSNSAYRENVGSFPIAGEVITKDAVNIDVSAGRSIENI
jgi:hypothetical protein